MSAVAERFPYTAYELTMLGYAFAHCAALDEQRREARRDRIDRIIMDQRQRERRSCAS